MTEFKTIILAVEQKIGLNFYDRVQNSDPMIVGSTRERHYCYNHHTTSKNRGYGFNNASHNR